MRLVHTSRGAIAVLALCAQLSVIGGALIGLCCAVDSHAAEASGNAPHEAAPACPMHAAPVTVATAAHHTHGSGGHEADRTTRVRCVCSPSFDLHALLGTAGLLTQAFSLRPPGSSAAPSAAPDAVPALIAILQTAPPPRL